MSPLMHQIVMRFSINYLYIDFFFININLNISVCILSSGVTTAAPLFIIHKILDAECHNN